ncbi:3-oxoacyl-[acyl-carrier-protein] synthase III C-terminal domain-containing protein [Filobacillus milosensis]
MRWSQIIVIELIKNYMNLSVKKGDIVLTLSAGTGYTWAATVIKW